MSGEHGEPSGWPDAVRRWPIGSVPRRVLLLVLLVYATATSLTLAAVRADALPTAYDLVTLAILGGLGLAHTEAALGVERARRRVTESTHVDLTSVWTFAAALLLPPVLAVALVLVLQMHIWRRAWYPRVPLFRQLFNTATIVLATLAAGVLARADPLLVVGVDLGRIQVVLLALVGYLVVNGALVAAAIMVSAERPDLAEAIGGWDENLLEITTLCLGALTAVALTINPLMAAFALPGLLLMHRAVLVHHLEVAASTDPKTGLLNAAAWHRRAERELERSGAPGGLGAVLVVDLDHFKRVNDTYGHLAGDEVLVAVAGVLRSSVRDRDVVGRFGGEEFVLLLAGDRGTPAAAAVVAERVRSRIGGLCVEISTGDGPLTVTGLSASVGGAVLSMHGHDVQGLLHVADTALYAAKQAGRDTVCMGPPAPWPRVEQPAPEPGG